MLLLRSLAVVVMFLSSRNQQAEGFVNLSTKTKSLNMLRHLLYLSSEKRGFARTGDDKRIMPSSLYKKRKIPRNIAQQTRDRPQPKKVQPTSEILKAPLIHPAMSCSCGSGLPYSKCCQRLHNGETIEIPSPEDVLRARYTGYKHNIAEYIIESTHPRNSEYEKYINLDFTRQRKGSKKWGKEILRTACDHNYCGLKILGSTVDEDLGFATVRFQTLIKEADGSYVATEEHSQFVQNSHSGRSNTWLYLDGEVNDVSDEDYDKLFEEFGDSADLESEDVSVTDEFYDQQRVLSQPAQAALVAIQESEKTAIRDKRGHRNRSRRTDAPKSV